MIQLNINIEKECSLQRQRYLQVIETIRDQTAKVFTPAMVDKCEKVFLTGCGDSLFACQGARMFFQNVTGMDIEPVEALEFSRYLVRHAKPNAILLAVSNSGRVSRTIEAVLRARKKGLTSVALTGYADRDLALSADARLVAALPNIRSTMDDLSNRVEQEEKDEMFANLFRPGLISKYAQRLGIGSGLDFLLFMLGAYMNSLLLLYCSAIHIGLVRGHLTQSQADEHYSEILNGVEVMIRTAAFNFDRIYVLADRFREKNAFLYLGTGPAFAAASLSAAKLFEQPHLNGVAQNLEEWAHLQFFFTRPDGVPIFVLVPPGFSRDRAIEQIKGMQCLGGTVVAICSRRDAEIQSLVPDTLLVQGDLPEEYVPWVYGVTGQLFAIIMMDIRGQPPIPPPFSFKQMMQVNFSQIYSSKIRPDLEE